MSDRAAKTQPAEFASAVTPSDSTVFADCRGLYIGVTGDVAVMMDGVSVTFTAVPAGAILPVRAERVMATGTTATNIVRLW